MIYGYKLKELRETKNFKHEDVANILELKRNAYTQYENEYEIIPTKHLNTLCNYYNVSFDYIFSFTNILNYENSSKEIDKIKAGYNLKEFRKSNKITQLKLSIILNTTQSTIAGYESGKCLIPIPFLYTICKKYNISADYLLGKIDNPKYL